MTGGEVVLSIVFGFAVNECCDVSPWIAKRLIRCSVKLQYGSTDRTVIRSEELQAYIDDRPGKLFKLFVAVMFFVKACALAAARSAKRPQRSAYRRSPVDLARYLVRMALSRATRVVAAPLRVLARIWRDEANPRWTHISWLWQPGWGRHAHDRLYRNANPYGIGASLYEQQKYDTIVKTLAGRQYRRVLEVGCGEGDLSERLAELSGDLLGVDISADAAARASARVPSATFETRMLPAEMPSGAFDLIVCSDVLYYWEPTTMRVGLDRLIDRLEPGGMLVVYHYRGDFGQVNTADNVHDRISALVGAGVVQRLTSECIDGIGPGGFGVRFDVLVVPMD